MIIDYTLKVDENYIELLHVLEAALNQAQFGKGKIRHGKNVSFTEQPILTICKSLEDPKSYGLLFQAYKKLEEGQRLPIDKRVFERLGAIIYIAAAIIRANKGEEIDE